MALVSRHRNPVNSFHLAAGFCLNRPFSAGFPGIVLTYVVYCESAVAHALQFPWPLGLKESIFSDQSETKSTSPFLRVRKVLL